VDDNGVDEGEGEADANAGGSKKASKSRSAMSCSTGSDIWEVGGGAGEDWEDAEEEGGREEAGTIVREVFDSFRGDGFGEICKVVLLGGRTAAGEGYAVEYDDAEGGACRGGGGGLIAVVLV